MIQIESFNTHEIIEYMFENAENEVRNGTKSKSTCKVKVYNLIFSFACELNHTHTMKHLQNFKSYK